MYTCVNPDAPLVEVDIGLLADQAGVPPTDTLNLRQGVHNLALAVHIGVQKTADVLCAARIKKGAWRVDAMRQ